MKKTLFATLFGMTAVVATSAFAQDPYSMSGGVGAPAYDQNVGTYDQTQSYGQQPQYNQQPAYAQQAQYPVQAPGYGQQPYPVQAPAYGYGVPQAAYAAPVCAVGSVWIDGYYDASGYYVNGYCTVPPFVGAFWYGPRFVGGRWFPGYWGRAGVGYGVGFRGGFENRGFENRGFVNPGVNRGFVNRGFAAPQANLAPRVNGGGFSSGFRGAAPSFHSAAPSFHAAAPSFRAPSGGSFNGGRSSGGFSGGSHAGGSSHGGRR